MPLRFFVFTLLWNCLRMYSPDSSLPTLEPPLTPLVDTRTTLRYSAYGLTIRSEIPLPEFTPLSPSDHAVGHDADVIYGNGEQWINPVRGERSFWSVLPHEARFWFQGVGGFRVHGGSEIVVSPEPEIEQSLLRMYVEGMMMACLLQQRGYYVLHASVVRIHDYGIAFLGHVGAGKSSMAAALHARGHAVVTDDNAAIDLAAPEPLVTPAFPSIKVFPEIAASLGYENNSLRLMHASQIKRARSVTHDFPEHPVPLRRIYVLNREEAPRAANENGMVRLSSSESTLELIRNSVPTRWRQPGNAAHLMQCGRLSRLLPAWRVRTFEALTDIPELARRIEQHSREVSDPA